MLEKMETTPAQYELQGTIYSLEHRLNLLCSQLLSCRIIAQVSIQECWELSHTLLVLWQLKDTNTKFTAFLITVALLKFKGWSQDNLLSPSGTKERVPLLAVLRTQGINRQHQMKWISCDSIPAQLIRFTERNMLPIVLPAGPVGQWVMCFLLRDATQRLPGAHLCKKGKVGRCPQDFRGPILHGTSQETQDWAPWVPGAPTPGGWRA